MDQSAEDVDLDSILANAPGNPLIFNYFISKNPYHVYYDDTLTEGSTEDANSDFISPCGQNYRFGVSIPCNHNHSLSLLVHRKEVFNKEINPAINRLTEIYHLSRCEAVCALHFMKTPSIPVVAINTHRSQETVRNHIKHTMQKMDVHSQAELMKKLITLSAL